MMDIPHISWHSLGIDTFTQDGKNYLIIADYHSKFPLVEARGNSATSEKIAQLTSKIISVFGVLNTIISDNGPQLQGTAYQNLMKKLGISHITSSPHHPKSHG